MNVTEGVWQGFLAHAEEARLRAFPLAVFCPAEPATHLLQVADELATKTGVPGDPITVARSPRTCNTLVATLQVAKSLRENGVPLSRTNVFTYCYKIAKKLSQTT